MCRGWEQGSWAGQVGVTCEGKGGAFQRACWDGKEVKASSPRAKSHDAFAPASPNCHNMQTRQLLCTQVQFFASHTMNNETNSIGTLQCIAHLSPCAHP